MNRTYRFAVRALCLAAAVALTGCSAGFSDSAPLPKASSGAALGGRVHGGQQPVSGARVYLYAAGNGGTYSNSRSMLDGTGYVTTGADGSFSITGDYTCQAGDLVYLVAQGGNPGMAAGTNNAKLVLETALGPCAALNAGMFFQINEVTTVAAAYALNGFQFNAASMGAGSSAQGQTGLANAFAMVNVLVNANSGTAMPEVSTASTVVPQSKINTLANVISSCVNSDGTGTPCANLFAATTYGFAPSDTLGALLQLASQPSLNPATVFAQSVANAPFQPSLASAPNDWTISVLFGQGQVTATHVAIDASGNAWFVQGTTGIVNGVYEIGPTGTVLSPPTGFLGGGNSPVSLSIDDGGNIWTANDPTGLPPSINKLDRMGNPISPVGGYPATQGVRWYVIAVDGAGAVWGDTTNVPAQKFDNNGNAITGASPQFTAADFYQLVTLPGNSMLGMSAFGSTIKEFSPLGVVTGSLALDANARFFAVDHAGDIWVVSDSSLAEYNSSGGRLSPAGGYTGGGIDGPHGITIDGAGTVWIASNGTATSSPKIASFGNSGNARSPSTGFTSPYLSVPVDVAVDPSGNVWVANSGSTGAAVFVGAGTPTVTPFATGIKNGTLATVPQ